MKTITTILACCFLSLSAFGQLTQLTLDGLPSGYHQYYFDANWNYVDGGPVTFPAIPHTTPNGGLTHEDIFATPESMAIWGYGTNSAPIPCPVFDWWDYTGLDNSNTLAIAIYSPQFSGNSTWLLLIAQGLWGLPHVNVESWQCGACASVNLRPHKSPKIAHVEPLATKKHGKKK